LTRPERLDAKRDYVTVLVRLSYLPPDLVRAILDGSHPVELNPTRVAALSKGLPHDWKDQRHYPLGSRPSSLSTGAAMRDPLLVEEEEGELSSLSVIAEDGARHIIDPSGLVGEKLARGIVLLRNGPTPECLYQRTTT